MPAIMLSNCNYVWVYVVVYFHFNFLKLLELNTAQLILLERVFLPFFCCLVFSPLSPPFPTYKMQIIGLHTMEDYMGLLMLLCSVQSTLTSWCCLVTEPCLTLSIPWTAAHRASLFMELSRQEYWSGLPFTSPGDLPGHQETQGSKLSLLH